MWYLEISSKDAQQGSVTSSASMNGLLRKHSLRTSGSCTSTASSTRCGAAKQHVHVDAPSASNPLASATARPIAAAASSVNARRAAPVSIPTVSPSVPL